jgi:hypothetical protein
MTTSAIGSDSIQAPTKKSDFYEEMKSKRSATDAALERATRRALLRHAHLGQEIVISRDGQIVWLSPKETFALYGLDEFGRDAQGVIEYPTPEPRLGS